MPRPSLPSRWLNAIFGLVALVVVIADQLSKAWIRGSLAVGQSIPLPGILKITHIRNSGAAFGLFQDHSLPLIIASFVALFVLLTYVLFLSHRFPLLDNLKGKATLGLILGGIIGNLIDRLRFGGYVTDFIDFGFWPAFNVADSAVTVGGIILASILLLSAAAER